jgi:hypothetical protein
MALLELVRTRPDWFSALEIALTRPEGVPERRTGEDPWAPPRFERPRRVSDDLAWLRCAIDEPREHGLNPVDDHLPIWEAPDDDRQVQARLERLHGRGILQAGGFLLHEADQHERPSPSAVSGPID